MRDFHRKILCIQRGAAAAEYAVAAGVLVLIFLVAGRALFSGAERRTDESAEVVANDAPCVSGGELGISNNYECM